MTYLYDWPALSKKRQPENNLFCFKITSNKNIDKTPDKKTNCDFFNTIENISTLSKKKNHPPKKTTFFPREIKKVVRIMK